MKYTYGPELVMAAVEFAKERHAGQLYSGRPYHEAHLIPVMDLVAVNSSDYDVIAAGVLHDVLEDTATTRAELTDLFGDRVAELVWRVTDEPGKNRKERKLLTYHKIREGGRRAILIKLCDRLHNVSGANPGLLEMYRKEHYTFQAALWEPSQFRRLWERIGSALEPPPQPVTRVDETRQKV